MNSPNRYLTKSRFKEALECPDKLFYSGRRKEYADSRDENEFLRELAKGGIQVGELAKCYFPGGIDVDTLDVAAALQRTNELLKEDTITIFEAAISYQNLLIRVDVLEKKGNVIKLYEVKAKSFSTSDELFTEDGKVNAKWDEYVYDITFQTYVTRMAFPDYIVRGSLLLIDKNTVCSVDGLYQKFLVRKIEGRYRITSNPSVEVGNKILGEVDLDTTIDEIISGTMALLGELLPFPEYVARLAASYAQQKRINVPVSSKCKSCSYKASAQQKSEGMKSGYEECWMTKANMTAEDFAKPHVFDVWGLKAEDFIAQKRYFITDLTKEDLAPKKETTSKKLITPAERRWLQVERVHNPNLGSYFDKEGFATEIKNLTYPLHFIDFEATRNAIPYLKGIRPYAQLAFQFSHHTLYEDGTLTHDEWINTARAVYPNVEFVRALRDLLVNNTNKGSVKNINNGSEKNTNNGSVDLLVKNTNKGVVNGGVNGSVMMYSTYENTVLLDIYDYLSASNEPDKDELIEFIKSITVSKKSKDSARPQWTGARAMVDMKDWIMNYYYSSHMKGSNSIKAVLPAILKESRYLQLKYPEWIKFDVDGTLINPYRLLPPVFDDIDRLTIEPLMEEDLVADGGAAMCAYNLMQFSEMGDVEREKITKALLMYCELDTLAMVMVFEGLRGMR